jgi:beta-lactamase class A
VDSDLPFSLPADQIRPLREAVDPALQKQLEKRLKNNRSWSRLIANHKMAVGVVDLSDPTVIRFARVNGDQMLYAASLPKLAVLLATSDALGSGYLEESPEILSDMRQMIAVSDNAASTTCGAATPVSSSTTSAS